MDELDHALVKEQHNDGNPFLQREQQIDIYQILSTLNEQQAEAIKLKYLRDLDYQSIAEITNVSVGTVKSRIFQGMKKLQSQFGGFQND